MRESERRDEESLERGERQREKERERARDGEREKKRVSLRESENEREKAKRRRINTLQFESRVVHGVSFGCRVRNTYPLSLAACNELIQWPKAQESTPTLSAPKNARDL